MTKKEHMAQKLVKEAWDLEVFKRAYALSLVIHKASKTYPFAKQEFSTAEFKRFISIAIGSATEMRIWIRYSVDLSYITKEQAKSWSLEYQAITRMLRSLYGK